MRSAVAFTGTRLAEAAARLTELESFAGPPGEFWAACLETLAQVAGARLAVLIRRVSGAEGAAEWRPLTQWSPGPVKPAVARALSAALPGLGEQALAAGETCTPLTGDDIGPEAGMAAAVRLLRNQPDESAVGVFLLDAASPDAAQEPLARLRLAAGLPEAYQNRRLLAQARRDVSHFSSVLDLMVLLNGQTRFMAACMLLCNEFASRFAADRVCLGWKKGDYVRLRAMSHAEKFDKKMAAVRAVEEAMEEALDQDEEIAWPPAAEVTAIVRDHEQYARSQGVANLCTVPLRAEGRPVAAITLERAAQAFTEDETAHLRLYADQAVRRLTDLEKHDRWFGARWLAAARRGLGRLIGVEHTWAKLGALAGAVALAVLLFGRASYRIQGSFMLQPADVVYLPAPFDGYIGEVRVRVGDEVAEGAVLLALDTRELLLEQAAAVADLQRYTRETEKARAADAFDRSRPMSFRLRLTHKIAGLGVLGIVGLAVVGGLYLTGTAEQSRYRLDAATARSR